MLSPLSGMWVEDVTDLAIAAIPDSMAFFRGTAEDYWRSISLPAEATYFNAGVMILNLDYWRANNVLTELTDWITVNRTLMVHSDQSALNAVLYRNVKLLDLKWNLQTPLIPPVVYNWGYTEQQLRAVQSPSIIHYVTERKPWLSQYRVEYSEYYWKFRSQLPWTEHTARLGRFSTARLKDDVIHLVRLIKASIRRFLRRAG